MSHPLSPGSNSSSSQSFLITEVEGTVISALDEGGVEDYIEKQKEAKRDLEIIRVQQHQRAVSGQRYNSDQKKTSQSRGSQHTMETEDYDDFMGEDGYDDDEYDNQAKQADDDDDESSIPDPNPSPESSPKQQRQGGRSGGSRGRKKKQSSSSTTISQRSNTGQGARLTNGYNAVPWTKESSRRQLRRTASGRGLSDDGVSQFSGGGSSLNHSRASGSSGPHGGGRRGGDIVENQEGGEEEDEDPVSQEAVHALQCAAIAARQFDTHFGAIKNPQRENGTPLFHSQELLTARDPIRQSGYYTEYALTAVRLVTENGQFGDHALPNTRPSSTSEKQQEARNRFMERSIDGHYAVKYLQAGLIEATDHGGTAAGDMIYETRILMNLTPQHPNVTPIYGVNSGGIDTFLETLSPKDGFFFVTDKIVETLQERMEQWRKGKKAKGRAVIPRMPERMDVAFDIASALLFLNDRNIVYYVRPDKVGFDAKQGIVKLCNFSQARFDGMQEHLSRSITKAADMGTLAYTAPEVLCKSPGTTSCDVYGFGIMLWELMSLRQPFAGYDRANHFEFVVQQHKRPPMNKKWSSDIKSLLLGCWDPHLRLSMRKVNESLERILVILNEEQQQLERESAPSNHSSEVGPQPQRRRKSAGAGRELLSSASNRSKRSLKDNPQQEQQETGEPQKSRQSRQSRRFSTGGAQGIELDASKNRSSSPPADQTAAQPRPRARRRKSGSAIVSNPNLKSEPGADTPDRSDDSDIQGASSSIRESLHSYNEDNMSAHVSVAYGSSKPSGKHPRRSSLGHVPAHVKRAPLYKRKNDSGDNDEFQGSSGNMTSRTEPISEPVTPPEPAKPPPTQRESSGGSRLGLHQYAMQMHYEASEREEDPHSDLGDVPTSNPKKNKRSSLRDKLASVKDALSGKGGLPRDITFESQPEAEEEKSMLDYVKPSGFSKAKRRASFA